MNTIGKSRSASESVGNRPTINANLLSRVTWTAALVLLFAGPVRNTKGAEKVQQATSFGTNWTVLAGEWVSDDAGQAKGTCGFHFDLDGKVMVRTNRAERTVGVHKDMMVIYQSAADDGTLANYWDNEGHTIEYSANWSADGKTLTFLSKAGGGPRFRLIYQVIDADDMKVSFEIAPPGAGNAFKPYTSGKIRRVPQH